MYCGATYMHTTRSLFPDVCGTRHAACTIDLTDRYHNMSKLRQTLRCTLPYTCSHEVRMDAGGTRKVRPHSRRCCVAVVVPYEVARAVRRQRPRSCRLALPDPHSCVPQTATISRRQRPRPNHEAQSMPDCEERPCPSTEFKFALRHHSN